MENHLKLLLIIPKTKFMKHPLFNNQFHQKEYFLKENAKIKNKD
jgi:hypothetical protein